MNFTQGIALPLLEGLAAGLIVAFAVIAFFNRSQRRTGQSLLDAAREEAARLRADALKEQESARQAGEVQGRMEAVRFREEVERELARRREEVERAERRAEERVRQLEERVAKHEASERAVMRREQGLAEREAELRTRGGEVDRLVEEQRQRLERVAGLSAEDARREVLHRAEDEARSQAAALARDIREQARRGAEREARHIVALAVQRLAAEHTSETTVAAVSLPNDEMKGRIIGREGRNIRAFEQATGVDLIIDDTPDTVVVSCFDPVRREIARRALATLVTDGRIHPGRIEEVVQKAGAELEHELVELGERATHDTGVFGLHPELIRLVGRMRYRTSYGQNILDHSKEVAWLAGMMAAELKLDVQLARRAALLHDIGKVLTHDHEGTHVELGVEVTRKYGEAPLVVSAIHAHHDDVPHETVESVLVQAADAISGARPGARREAFETYVKRLTKLEEIANGFAGVEKSNVIQAGREVRVVVTPEQVDDAVAAQLAEQIAKRIEHELQYPGQIKVVVIRETRTSAVAR